MELSLWSLLLVVLIFLSAMFSSSEVAFFSLTAVDLDNISNQGSTASKKLILLKQKPRQLLATILVANNFVNIGIVILFDFIFRHVFANDLYTELANKMALLFGLEVGTVASIARGLEFMVTVIVATSVLMLFGEILPKLYANINNVSLALRLARPITIVQRMLYPFTHLLVKYSSIIEAKLSKLTPLDEATSKDEISKAIDLTASHDQSHDGVNILKRIVGFGEVSVKEIMKSRVDVVALDIQSDFIHVLEIIRKSGFSRFPVYQDDFDKIVGILYAKDLLIHINSSKDFDWQSLVREEVKYVPEGKRISDLIKEIQQERKHMVIVVDEFGGSSGIVTLEDIMEEVIGDIKDEFDDEYEIDYVKVNDQTYIFEGKTHLKDMCYILNIGRETFDDYRGDSDSVAGLMLEIFGRLPKKNKEVKIHGYSFQVTSVNSRRIEKVQISLPS